LVKKIDWPRRNRRKCPLQSGERHYSKHRKKGDAMTFPSHRFALLIAGSLLIAASLPAQTPPATQPAPSQGDLDRKFETTMSHAVLAGSFTVNGSDKPPAHDRYTLGSVTKKSGDTWLFVATVQYGNHDLSLPLEIPVKWAGDTPVISVTNIGMPGLGTYTARVMVYGDQYVGVWGTSDGSHGGQMWGKIEHPTTKPAASPAK
jgi:hypothetical protein